MKKLITPVAAFFVLAATPVFACDQQEAVDLMVKVSTALGEKAGAAKTEEDSLKVTAANARMNEGGAALSAGDPDKACEIYRAVAKDEGISLE
ncbi:hypothetical protein [Dongia rigui]|uniref:Uncharacterized protein n=1 Tax=Dongia rigui TaxID=940149 RepID=A0ABU5DZF9_9PROT|nr:hypothetical protein [Dongia rigui]MDY0872717.1 hypothetical protein [Dongia rigui]